MEGKKINRRAMKDIGNIVGALSAKCTITKGRVAPTKKLGATLAKTQAMMQVAPPHKEVEEHMNLGTRKRNAMLPSVREGNQKKHELENSYVAMKNCPTLVSVPCHQEIISQSEETFLKNESESKIIDLTYQDEDDDECCEMEIEEAEDPVPDIDEADKGNPLAVADYVQDIYSFYRETEVRSCVPPDYMSHQPDINEKLRAILVDWLIKIHLEFKLMDETLFLVINIFDRYLSRKTVVRKSLQLVAVAAMFVACKYEELSIPIVEDFIYISDNAYTRDEILQMEKSILNTLQFSLALPTPFVFMKRFLKAAGSDRNLEMVSSFLVELCLVEYVMLKYPPSMVAAAAVYTGHCTLKRAPFWNRTMVFHTTYTEDHLIECSKLMVGFHKNAREGKLTGVHRKYSTPKFHGVAKLEPALFIGENPQSPSPVSFIRI